SITWEMQPGEHWVILGPNGAGKSTLVSVLCGYLWPTSGSVRVLGETYGRVHLGEFRKRIGIFQPGLQRAIDTFHPGETALDIILTGLDGSLVAYNQFTNDQHAQVYELYDRYFSGNERGPSYPLERRFGQLSSGERRKVLLLRMLISRPELVLLDEPFESLDIPSRFELEGILSDFIRRSAVPSVHILHRVEEIPSFATHALLLDKGKVFRKNRIESTINSETLSALYQVSLKVGMDQNRFYCVPA
ncbi:MAG: ATP-binding cassette domain-containing protein, partial [Leptospiraceae bacterium]|nr:ATP-binding cassette domain-containing protein [Leptospiraceae bacterium]